MFVLCSVLCSLLFVGVCCLMCLACCVLCVVCGV